ncbi:MAG TPA: peptidyl-prolyl cis-trans isomerase, partial [Vicinamibacteria bacterium]
PITVGEFQRDYRRQRQNLERLYAGRLDPAAIKSLGIESQVLGSLVNEQLVVLEARRLGIRVTDEELVQHLRTLPSFQENGRFVGGEGVRRLLDMQGIGIEEFEEDLRKQLLERKLQTLVTSAVDVTAPEVEREFRRRTEQVKVEYALVDAGRHRSEVKVEDDEVRAHFEERKDAYRIPEKRVVSYVLVDTEAMKARVAVTDGDVQTYYEQHKEELIEPEEVCASHILVKVKAGPDDGEGHPEPAARALAESLLKRVQEGADFAATARSSSEDKGSADRGGELGCFPRGRMVPEFDSAAFSLSAGETSDLVRTGFGFHIIRVTSRREEQTPPLQQVKVQLREALLGQRASDLVEDKVAALGTALRRGKGLEEAAKDQGLTVAKSPPLVRGGTVEPLASPSLVARAFEMKAGEVEPKPFPLQRGYAFVALSEVQPSREATLDEAKDRVRADLVRETALARAREEAAALKVRASREGLEKAATAMGLLRKETPSPVGRGQPLGDLGTGEALEEAAFSLPEGTLSNPVATKDGYAVLRVLERKPFDAAAFEAQRESVAASLRAEKQAQFFRAYMASVRERFEIETRPDVLKRVVG